MRPATCGVRRATGGGIALLIVALLFADAAGAQQVAVRRYTVDDGLGNDTVGSAFQDSRGFLWFATAEGLSRFDGYQFVTYTKKDGLGADVVHRIDESAEGTLWVATNAGLARLTDRAGRGTFVTTPVGRQGGVASFAIAADGAVWCPQSDGMYRGVVSGETTQFTLIAAYPATRWRPQAFRDRAGRIWSSRDARVFHVDGMSVVEHSGPSATEPVRGFSQKRDGTLIVATTSGIWSLVPGAEPAGDRWQPIVEDLKGVQTVLADSRDRLWIGNASGLLTVDVTRGGAVAVKGVSDGVSGIIEDRDGNIWVTTVGVSRIAAEPIVNYTRADGLSDPFIVTIVEGDGGKVYAVTSHAGTFELRNDGTLLVPGSAAEPFTTVRRRMVHDGRNWWMWTNRGLYRIEGTLDFRRATFLPDAGPPFAPDADGPSLLVNPQGGVWIGTSTGRVLHAAEPASPVSAWKAMQLESSLPPPGRLAMTRVGALWIGTHAHLVRLTGNRPERIPAQTGLPDTFVRALFLDSRGWLWVGTFSGGVSVTRDPDAPKPTFTNYSRSEGLASGYVSSITEDRRGRMYFATGRGLDRLDPQTGRIHHIRTADGLASPKVTYCMRDSRGHIWVGTTAGASRIVPDDDDREHSPPPVLITAVTADDQAIPLPPRGTRDPLALQLASSRASVRIDYVAIDFRGENTLQYQFRLGGPEQPWSTPTDSRTVIYGKLAAGTYAFAVRAIGPDGTGPETTALTLTVLPHLWQRWWFILLALSTVAAAAFGLYRQRMNQLLAVERVRRQVALDLHDDVGAGLVQIAAMGELAAEDPHAGARMWPDVAAVARSLRDSMSDIVWAVDPSKDYLSDLVQRLKDVAYAALEADSIAVEFNAPSQAEMARIQMPTDRRRHVLLVLKEAVTNIVRHAGATRVRIDLSLNGRELHLVIADNGTGFDSSARGGNGLASMRRRAAEAGGRLEVLSTHEQGATIRLIVPA